MKSLKNLIIPVAAFAFLLTIILQACQKDLSGNSATKSTVSVYLTDGPADYSAVNIDIKFVEVKVDTMKGRCNDDHAGDRDMDANNDRMHGDGFGVWDTLAYNPGVYDLASLRNGVETALGTLTVNGVVRKIRFTLGTNNSVVKSGVTYPLNLAPGTNNYLYVNLHNEHRQNNGGDKVGVWVDFDLAHSIVEANGQFYLRPVLKPFCDKNFAAIEGKVLPADAKAVVSVYNSTDSAIAIPRPDGMFLIRGLKPGTYTVQFKASNGYKDATIAGVEVTTGNKVTLPVTTLTK